MAVSMVVLRADKMVERWAVPRECKSVARMAALSAGQRAGHLVAYSVEMKAASTVVGKAAPTVDTLADH